MNTDTPLPPDEPGSDNPPDGAVIDYYLGASSAGPVTLEIHDAAGQLVRRYSSADPIPVIDPMLAIPPYWVRPFKGLSANRGLNRFLWDMHYPPVPGLRPTYPIAAIYQNTAPAFTSPWVMPGKYTAVLRVNNKTYTQPLVVEMDPRVKTSTRDLATQINLSKQMYDRRVEFTRISDQTTALRSQLADIRKKATTDDVKTRIDALNAKLDTVVGVEVGADPAGKVTIRSTSARVTTLFSVMQGVDLGPTPSVVTAVAQLQTDAQRLTAQWEAIKSQDVAALNEVLRAAGLPPVTL
jgi:hypothetical protein